MFNEQWRNKTVGCPTEGSYRNSFFLLSFGVSPTEQFYFHLTERKRGKKDRQTDRTQERKKKERKTVARV